MKTIKELKSQLNNFASPSFESFFPNTSKLISSISSGYSGIKDLFWMMFPDKKFLGNLNPKQKEKFKKYSQKVYEKYYDPHTLTSIIEDYAEKKDKDEDEVRDMLYSGELKITKDSRGHTILKKSSSNNISNSDIDKLRKFSKIELPKNELGQEFVKKMMDASYESESDISSVIKKFSDSNRELLNKLYLDVDRSTGGISQSVKSRELIRRYNEDPDSDASQKAFPGVGTKKDSPLYTKKFLKLATEKLKSSNLDPKELTEKMNIIKLYQSGADDKTIQVAKDRYKNVMGKAFRMPEID